MTTSTTESRSRASYGFGTELDVPFEEAIERTKAALKSEGFGVLTTIDVRQTMKEKLDVEFEPYVILGACNPPLAHRALQAEHELGLLLPCNVIVHEHDGKSVVSIVDPEQMLGFVGDNPALREVAKEAAARLRRVVNALERDTAGSQ
ncbi:MAG: ABC transporter ATP-binding protein [Chloroflexota bacterium]